MAATATPVVLDTPAAEFRLPATDGKTYALARKPVSEVAYADRWGVAWPN